MDELWIEANAQTVEKIKRNPNKIFLFDVAGYAHTRELVGENSIYIEPQEDYENFKNGMLKPMKNDNIDYIKVANKVKIFGKENIYKLDGEEISDGYTRVDMKNYIEVMNQINDIYLKLEPNLIVKEFEYDIKKL